MKPLKEYPPKIRPYLFHGVRLRENGTEASGECPFCTREGKFSVNVSTGQWKCWVCGTGSSRGGGNIYTFLREYHAMCIEATKVDEYREFAEQRQYCDPQVLIEWQLCKSVLNGDWLVPGYNPHSQLTSLYRYIKQQDGGYRLIPTPTLGHHLFGMNHWDESKPVVYLTEGPWDAMAMWEVMTQCKNSDRGFTRTASRESSLYSQANIIGVPGCETFFEPWLPIFEDKLLNIMFDNDHPRKNSRTGSVTPGGAWRGMERIVRMFSGSRHKPTDIQVLKWGEDGYDIKRKSGFDVRDYLTTE